MILLMDGLADFGLDISFLRSLSKLIHPRAWNVDLAQAASIELMVLPQTQWEPTRSGLDTVVTEVGGDEVAAGGDGGDPMASWKTWCWDVLFSFFYFVSFVMWLFVLCCNSPLGFCQCNFSFGPLNGKSLTYYVVSSSVTYYYYVCLWMLAFMIRTCTSDCENSLCSYRLILYDSSELILVVLSYVIFLKVFLVVLRCCL